jgi:uncharacterized membrane protein
MRRDTVPTEKRAADTLTKRIGTSSGRPRAVATLAAGVLVAGVALAASAGPAAADLRLCNKTDSTVSIAIGYKAKDGWRTEGWWNIEGDKCGTLLSGSLGSRFYYLYAVDSNRGGEWSGKAFMCTRRKMFTIVGVEDCVARGYERTGFFEIDTAEQRSWTIHLYQPTQKGNGATK